MFWILELGYLPFLVGVVKICLVVTHGWALFVVPYKCHLLLKTYLISGAFPSTDFFKVLAFLEILDICHIFLCFYFIFALLLY